jgi:uroporphyrinogen III methyltransferase/synthase
MIKGKVFLIGSGDPALITEKAKYHLEMADCVFYESSIHPNTLHHAKNGPIWIKISRNKREWKKKILDYFSLGHTIVLLMHGDTILNPFSFQYLTFLVQHQIPYEVVPGISELTSMCLTGQIFLGKEALITFVLDEQKFIKTKTCPQHFPLLFSLNKAGTYLMKLLKQFPALALQPSVYICKKNHQRLEGTLLELSDKLKNDDSSALLMVGQQHPLFSYSSSQGILNGIKILLLRGMEQSQELTQELVKLGANVIQCPLIECIPNPVALAQLSRTFLSSFKILIFTSANGVRLFMRGLLDKDLDIRILANKNILAVGPKTKEALKQMGILADAMPHTFCAEGIFDLLKDQVKGEKILIPTATKARSSLPQQLKKQGAYVKVLKIYKNICPKMKRILVDHGDFVIFTSPSTVNRFFNSPFYQQQRIQAFCIGEVTSKEVAKYQVESIQVAQESTIHSLVECICHYVEASTSHL